MWSIDICKDSIILNACLDEFDKDDFCAAVKERDKSLASGGLWILKKRNEMIIYTKILEIYHYWIFLVVKPNLNSIICVNLLYDILCFILGSSSGYNPLIVGDFKSKIGQLNQAPTDISFSRVSRKADKPYMI